MPIPLIVWGIGGAVALLGLGVATGKPEEHDVRSASGAPPPGDETAWTEDLADTCESGYLGGSTCTCGDVTDWLKGYKKILDEMQVAKDDLARVSASDDEDAMGLIDQSDQFMVNFHNRYGINYLDYDCDPGLGTAGSKAYIEIKDDIVPQMRRANEHTKVLVKAFKSRADAEDVQIYDGPFAGLAPKDPTSAIMTGVVVGGTLAVALKMYADLKKKESRSVPALPAKSSGRLKLP